MGGACCADADDNAAESIGPCCTDAEDFAAESIGPIPMYVDVQQEMRQQVEVLRATDVVAPACGADGGLQMLDARLKKAERVLNTGREFPRLQADVVILERILAEKREALEGIAVPQPVPICRDVQRELADQIGALQRMYPPVTNGEIQACADLLRRAESVMHTARTFPELREEAAALGEMIAKQRADTKSFLASGSYRL